MRTPVARNFVEVQTGDLIVDIGTLAIRYTKPGQTLEIQSCENVDGKKFRIWFVVYQQMKEEGDE